MTTKCDTEHSNDVDRMMVSVLAGGKVKWYLAIFKQLHLFLTDQSHYTSLALTNEKFSISPNYKCTFRDLLFELKLSHYTVRFTYKEISCFHVPKYTRTQGLTKFLKSRIHLKILGTRRVM